MTDDQLRERLEAICAHLRLIDAWDLVQQDITRYLAKPYRDLAALRYICERICMRNGRPTSIIPAELLVDLDQFRYYSSL